MTDGEAGNGERRGSGSGLLPRGAGSQVLGALAAGEKSVGELVKATGLSQPNVSNHLARLKERGFVQSRREGRLVIYRATAAALAHVAAAHNRGAGAHAVAVAEVAEQFLTALLTLREEEAIRVTDYAIASGVGWRELYLEVFTPALVEVGELWERKELSVAKEHLITGIVTRLLHRLATSLPAVPGPAAFTAIVGCVEGELHTVGGRMASDFLIAAGWRVWYLNGYLPLEHLMEAVGRHLPDAVVLCASTPDVADDALPRTVQRLLRWRGEQPLPLIVAGGRYFETPQEIPGIDISGTDIEVVTEAMERRLREVRGLPAIAL